MAGLQIAERAAKHWGVVLGALLLAASASGAQSKPTKAKQAPPGATSQSSERSLKPLPIEVQTPSIRLSGHDPLPPVLEFRTSPIHLSGHDPLPPILEFRTQPIQLQGHGARPQPQGTTPQRSAPRRVEEIP